MKIKLTLLATLAVSLSFNVFLYSRAIEFSNQIDRDIAAIHLAREAIREGMTVLARCNKESNL
jgi:hypothetical protein